MFVSTPEFAAKHHDRLARKLELKSGKRGTSELVQQRIKQSVEMWRQGWGTKQIAEVWGVTRQSARGYLRMGGVDIDRRLTRKRNELSES